MPDEPDTTETPAKPATLTADRATEIAREHGLNLSDAVAIHSLATTEKEAHNIAARFAPEHLPGQSPTELADAVRARQKGQA